MYDFLNLKDEIITLWNDGRGKMLIVIASGWFLSIGVRLVYPIILPHIRTTYGLNFTSAGFLLSVLWFAYGFGQLPGGLLSDRFGEGTIMTVSTLLSAGALTLVVTAGSVPILFGATVLFGLGTALYGVARFTILAGLFPDQIGAATGVTMAAGDAGNSILPPVAGLIATMVAWQYGFGFTIPLFLLVAIGLWIIVPKRTSEPTSAVDTISLRNARYVLSELRQPSIIHGTTLLLLGNCIWQAFTGFYPIYLIEIKGFSETVAGVLFGLFFALGVVIKPLSGGAYDRIGVRRSLLIVMTITGLTLVILPLIEGFWLLLAATVLMSGLLGYGTILLAYLTTVLPEDMRGTGLGVARTTYTMIGSMSPVLFGVAADRGFFDEGFFVLALLAGGMIIFVIRFPIE